MSDDELKDKVEDHDKVLYGDRERPGIIAQHIRTNEILTEVRGDLRRVNWLILSGVILAVLNMLHIVPDLPR